MCVLYACVCAHRCVWGGCVFTYVLVEARGWRHGMILYSFLHYYWDSLLLSWSTPFQLDWLCGWSSCNLSVSIPNIGVTGAQGDARLDVGARIQSQVLRIGMKHLIHQVISPVIKDNIFMSQCVQFLENTDEWEQFWLFLIKSPLLSPFYR